MTSGEVWAADRCARPEAVSAVMRRSTGAPNPLHQPGRWVPHVTLAARLRPGQAAAAVDLLGSLTGVEGTVCAASSYDTVTREVTPL